MQVEVLLSAPVQDGGFRLRPETSTFRVALITVLMGGRSGFGSPFASRSARPRVTHYLRSGDDNDNESQYDTGRTSRVVTTTTSRSVSMTQSDYNLNPVIDARPRW